MTASRGMPLRVRLNDSLDFGIASECSATAGSLNNPPVKRTPPRSTAAVVKQMALPVGCDERHTFGALARSKD